MNRPAKSIFHAIILSLLFACTTHIAGAQQITANLSGTASDASGAVVSGVIITVTQTETGFTRSANSNSQGEYFFVELPVGHYKLQAEAKGFQLRTENRELRTIEKLRTVFDALGWQMAERLQQSPLLAGDAIDIAFTIGHNDHPDFGGLELELRDFRSPERRGTSDNAPKAANALA